MTIDDSICEFNFTLTVLSKEMNRYQIVCTDLKRLANKKVRKLTNQQNKISSSSKSENTLSLLADRMAIIKKKPLNGSLEKRYIAAVENRKTVAIKLAGSYLKISR